MLETSDIVYVFGVAAGIWALGFSYGKAVAWIRAIRSAV